VKVYSPLSATDASETVIFATLSVYVTWIRSPVEPIFSGSPFRHTVTSGSGTPNLSQTRITFQPLTIRNKSNERSIEQGICLCSSTGYLMSTISDEDGYLHFGDMFFRLLLDFNIYQEG
jgi:hypothetical protein